MKRNRFILIALWILSLVGISYYGGAVAYGFFAAVTLTPILSFFYILVVYFRFKIYQELDRKNVVAGSVSNFYITLQNEDFFAHSSIRIHLYSLFSTITGIEDHAEYELLPFSGTKNATSLICKYRGEYEVGVKSVSVTDYLRLFTITFRMREPFRINVLPRIVTLDAPKTLEQADATAGSTQQNPTEPDVTVRNYIPGDDIRKIHWKAVASTHQLLVRNTIGEEKHGIGIIMDPVRYSNKPDAYLPLEDKISEIVLALCLYYERSGTNARIYTYPAKSVSHLVKDNETFQAFYQFLAHFRFHTDNRQDLMFSELLSAKDIYTHKLVILVLHEITPEAAAAITALEQNDISVVVYLVSDPSKDATGKKLPTGTDIFPISVDDDLKEVL